MFWSYELKYYYSLSRRDSCYLMKARFDAPSLIMALPDPLRGLDSDAIIVTGDIELDPISKPVPHQTYGLGRFLLLIVNLICCFSKLKMVINLILL